MAAESRQATVTTPGEREIRIERVFAAPRERVFAAMTDPALIPRWWGSRTDTTVVEEMEPRAGGAWRFFCENGEGGGDRFRGYYREVTAPERIVQTFEWAGMPGFVSLETATLEEVEGQTRFVTVSRFFTSEERDGMLSSGMEGGVKELYERLDELLAAGS